MAKKLQVVLQDCEYRDVERAARAVDLPIREWVRRALERALQREASSSIANKLEAIQASKQYAFPTADIHRMLAEIEQGVKTQRS
jgi:monomeric isocitrate dehydrogenase